jgi:hypothetical protein
MFKWVLQVPETLATLLLVRLLILDMCIVGYEKLRQEQIVAHLTPTMIILTGVDDLLLSNQ